MGAYRYVLFSVCGLLAVLQTAGAAENHTDVPPVPIQHSSCNLNSGCPVVSSLLQAVGFSPACVASSLAICSTLQGEHQFQTFVQDVQETLSEIRESLKETAKRETRPRHCRDLQAAGDSGVGVRYVYPFPHRPQEPVSVYCDHTTDGGGWTVFQRRTNATTRLDFYRTWIEYQLGFGSPEAEFWLGLNPLHAITSSALHELRVDLVDYEGERRWAKYGLFNVGTPDTFYRLAVGRYTGDAGDGLASDHPGASFSTHDADHDKDGTNCASSYRGGWWYGSCHLSNLNGYQHSGSHEAYAEGINWQPWKGYHYSLMNTTLMTRPAF